MTMNETTTKQGANTTEGEFRPKFSVYHPNGKCTGCALKMELLPAHGDTDGCIMMSLAAQKTVGDLRGAIKKFPTFDWEKRICVKLDFADICKILQVFRGECETLEDGKGLYHRSARFTTRIVLRHLTEPVQGYSLEVYRDRSGLSDESQSVHLVMNTWEALGVSLAFENSIGVICFGIPRVMARDKSGEGLEEVAYDVPA